MNMCTHRNLDTLLYAFEMEIDQLQSFMVECPSGHLLKRTVNVDICRFVWTLMRVKKSSYSKNKRIGDAFFVFLINAYSRCKWTSNAIITTISRAV